MLLVAVFSFSALIYNVGEILTFEKKNPFQFKPENDISERQEDDPSRKTTDLDKALRHRSKTYAGQFCLCSGKLPLKGWMLFLILEIEFIDAALDLFF
jgi:hypothetical protein